ncbi:MAG: Mut7-C RNAse domain-containing protein, partial [Actinobacteria bacterium]|nr:Mut7-C RNAse domain-containing protein [Actinomycetota bacterium]
TKEEIASELPPHTAQTQEEFRRCPLCGRIYWKGTQYKALNRFLASLGAKDEEGNGVPEQR